MAYRDLKFSWAFVLRDEGTGCRLFIRARTSFEPAWSWPPTWLFMRLVRTPGDWVNVRGTLRGIKRRAERGV